MKREKSLPERVKEYIKRNDMFPPQSTIVAAVSGGPDSIALLHILKSLEEELKLNLLAAHVNHKLRPEADEEEELVRRVCAGWQISLRTVSADIKSLAEQSGKTIEETGRDFRYDYLDRLRKDTGSRYIATAHHRDDQAETVLLHLLRGSGIKGLRGIMPVNGYILRPLLQVYKSDLLEYLHDLEIEYSEDESNANCEYKRNHIRHELIPYLQKSFNPAIIDNLARLAEIARVENQYLEDETRKIWLQLAEYKGSDLFLPIDDLLEIPSALQNRVILKALFVMGGEQGWNKAAVEKILRFCLQPGSSKFLTLSGGLQIKKIYQALQFTYRPVTIKSFCYNVNIPGRIVINETGSAYDFKVVTAREYSADPADLALDYDRLDLPLWLRSRQSGDVFLPIGFKGSKKLKKMFIDHKIAYETRNTIPVLASAKEIYALLGWQASRIAAVNESAVRILVVKKV